MRGPFHIGVDLSDKSGDYNVFTVMRKLPNGVTEVVQQTTIRNEKVVPFVEREKFYNRVLTSIKNYWNNPDRPEIWEL